MVDLHDAKTQTLLRALGSPGSVLGALVIQNFWACSVPSTQHRNSLACVNKMAQMCEEGRDGKEMRAGGDTAIRMYFTHEWQRSARLVCLDAQDQEGGPALRTGRPDPASCSCHSRLWKFCRWKSTGCLFWSCFGNRDLKYTLIQGIFFFFFHASFQRSMKSTEGMKWFSFLKSFYIKKKKSVGLPRNQHTLMVDKWGKAKLLGSYRLPHYLLLYYIAWHT